MNQQHDSKKITVEEIIQGLRDSEKFYEEASKTMDIPALIEDVRKKLIEDERANS